MKCNRLPVLVITILPLILSLPIAPYAAAATFLTHFDAADIDGTGTQTGDICARTDTTWVDLSGISDGTLTNFTLPCTADEGWKGDGSIANPYRLHFDGDWSGGNRVEFLLDSPQSLNLWFHDDPDIVGYSDIVFSHGTNSYIRVKRAVLEVVYNGGAAQHTGFSMDEWHMLTVVNDGSTTRYYVDNVEFASVSGSPSTTSASAVLGGNGSIAGFRAYSDALTRAEITDLYQQERYRFEPDPGALRIDRIQDAFDSTAGGKTVTIYGQHFEAVTDVTFDGLSGTNILLQDQGRITVETPAHMVGYVDVTVISSTSGGDTRPDAFYYTETPLDNMQLWFDAGNNDAAGGKGEASTTDPWANLLYGSDGGLMNIDLPATADEGWKGSGPADPYRLQLNGDGSLALPDAVAYYIDSPRSINIWFKVKDLPESQGSVMEHLSPDIAGIWVQPDGDLVFNYNGESVFAAQPITLNEWHMATIFNDGDTTHYYLDNEEVTTEANTPSTDAAVGALGGQDGGLEKGFNGSICDFRVYDDALTVAEIDTLFHEKRNCYAASRPVSVGSLVWRDLDADGQQNNGEPGIAGAMVRLLDGNGDPIYDADGVLVVDQITGSDGVYSFVNLLPGDYMVEVTPPADSGLMATLTPADPDPDTNPSNSDSNGVDVCEPGNITPVIIDNGDTEFSQSGFLLNTSQGYQGDIHYTSGNSSGDVATWTFSALPPAQYRVMATWPAGVNWATDAPYAVRDTIVDINQQAAPDDLLDDGVFWEEIGVFTVSNGSLVVELSDDADGYVIADAIRLSQGVTECEGVLRSPLFTLTTGDQPVDEQFANGADDQDGEPDIDGNMTVDFGFKHASSTDLQIVKTASPDPAIVGQNLTYTLLVTNLGPDSATGVTVVDTLPAQVSHVSSTPSQGTCGYSAGVVTCSLGTIPNGGSATITIVVAVDQAM